MRRFHPTPIYTEKEVAVPDLRSQLDKSVVRLIFDSLGQSDRLDQSLPEVVLENRRRHAYTRVLDALESRGVPAVPTDLRARLQSIVESWSSRSFDNAFQPIQEFEIQCARGRDLVAAEQSGDLQRVLGVLESEYRRRVAEHFGSIELRGIQLNHRVVLDLDRVYVPLHFQALHFPTWSRRVSSASERRLPIAQIIEDNLHMLLIGSPGSGKSTLVSFLASRCAAGKHAMSWPDRALPLVVTVRELKDGEFTAGWLAARLEVSPTVVSAALAEDRAVILVDGVDEAPENLRKQLLRSLLKFVREYPRAPVIVTSRPSGAPGEVEGCLPGFQAFRIVDLNDAEVSEFVDKWCIAAERSARPDSAQADREASAAAADLKSRIVRSRPVQRIAVNPLLTTILCVVHRFLGRTIPEHRVTLYEKCTDALLYEWDRAKFQKNAAVGDLDANQKRALLRGIACALHERHKAEISESEVVRHFASTLPQIGKPQEDALSIVREIRDRSGLLVERRPGAFAFSHLTFQEYLTALDYASRPEQLLDHLDDPWWHEVIALAAGIPGCDPSKIIRALLQKENRGATILAAKCIETAVNVPLDVRAEVDNAIERILPPNDTDDAFELQEIGMTVAPILARKILHYNEPSRGSSLFFFWFFTYEPVIPVLDRLTSDTSPTPIGIRGGSGRQPYTLTVGELAVAILKDMAMTSERAKHALISALERKHSEEFISVLKPWEVLGEDFRVSRRGKRSSKPAKSIA